MKITFVCLGNICRSPMAEYLAKDIINKNKIKGINIESCGTANYHEGEFMHKKTSDILKKMNIYHSDFKSKQITKKIFDLSNFVIVMDDSNYKDVINYFGNHEKIIKITDFCDIGYTFVPDPWYTNNFDETLKVLDNSIKNFFRKKLNIN